MAGARKMEIGPGSAYYSINVLRNQIVRQIGIAKVLRTVIFTQQLQSDTCNLLMSFMLGAKFIVGS